MRKQTNDNHGTQNAISKNELLKYYIDSLMHDT